MELKSEKDSRYLKAIFHIVAAAFGFAMMSVFVKLSGDIPSLEKTFFRNVIAAGVAFAILLKKGESLKKSLSINKNSRLTMFLRCTWGTAGLVANFWAIDHMNISDVNMLNKLSPFFAMLVSIAVLKEKPNKNDWVCIIVAFIGAAFIVKPTSGIAGFPAFIGLFGGFAAGAAYTYVRKLGKQGIEGAVIVFFFSTFSTLVTLPTMIFDFTPMSMESLVYLLLAGTMAALGQINITAAYGLAPAKDISVFDYTQVLFAAVSGYFIFGEIPDYIALAGYVLIIGAAFYKWLRRHG